MAVMGSSLSRGVRPPRTKAARAVLRSCRPRQCPPQRRQTVHGPTATGVECDAGYWQAHPVAHDGLKPWLRRQLDMAWAILFIIGSTHSSGVWSRCHKLQNLAPVNL